MCEQEELLRKMHKEAEEDVLELENSYEDHEGYIQNQHDLTDTNSSDSDSSDTQRVVCVLLLVFLHFIPQLWAWP